MNVEIIAIGTELINARVCEANSVFLANELKKMGYAVNVVTLVSDDEMALEAVLCASLGRANIVFTSGGLGSTHDDITKRYVAKVLNHKLTLNADVLDGIKKKYEERQVEMTANIQKQALLPRRCIVVQNRFGTAPGFICQEDEKLIISLPGVPKEFRQMWSDEVKGFLNARFGDLTKEEIVFLRTYGLSEMEVSDLVSPLLQRYGITWGIMPGEEGVDLELSLGTKFFASGDANIPKLKDEIEQVLGNAIYSWENVGMEFVIAHLLKLNDLRIATAESCTGGLVAHRLTQVPGISKYFERGLITYSNESKKALLGVKPSTLNDHGAVSSNVALEMAMGIRELAGTDIGLSTTGIAGPDGGSLQKPVGLFYCALSTLNGCFSHSFKFTGDRTVIKFKGSQVALNILRLYLKEKKVK